MKTIEQIKDLMVGKSVIADLADLLRANDADFAESEKGYYAAVEKLRASLPAEQTPSLDEYLSACETDVISVVAYLQNCQALESAGVPHQTRQPLDPGNASEAFEKLRLHRQPHTPDFLCGRSHHQEKEGQPRRTSNVPCPGQSRSDYPHK